MTRGDFLDLVLSFLEPHGNPYVEERELQCVVVNRRLRLYTALTRCLYDDAVVFTVETDEPLYDAHGTAFSQDLHYIESIWIDGAPLRNFQNKLGPCSLSELRQHEGNYLTADSAKPRRWALIPSKTVRLFPAPDQVYSDCYAQGHLLHPEIDTDESGDETDLSIPEPYASNSAVAFAAVGFLKVNASVASDLEMMKGMSESAWTEMKDLMDQADTMLEGPSIRGGEQSGVVSLS